MLPESAGCWLTDPLGVDPLPVIAVTWRAHESRNCDLQACVNKNMRSRIPWVIIWLGVISTASGTGLYRGTAPGASQIEATLAAHQYDLESEGRSFLLNEAKNSQFLLLGELHGDKEIPALLRALWPEMWKEGYRYIGAEVSPWAAHQLESVPAAKGPEILGLWTKQQATDVHAAAGQADASVIWGCDMEEEQPQFLIRQLGALNPGDSNLRQMAELTHDRYDRTIAPRLLDLVKKSRGTRDEVVNDVSLRENLVATLEIENNRLSPDSKMIAQEERERLMKQQFLEHFRQHSGQGIPTKVLLRFGRNHLHRGYDARGISTLGNFVAEFAVTHSSKVFNVGAFGAGGEATLLGETWNADERQEEPAFALLAEKAKHPATLFDLRPLRAMLHQIPTDKRSSLQNNLIYWADSYDALICYKQVTPLAP
jgi:hypothetical protein